MSLNTFKHQSAQADPFLRARKCDKAPPPGMKIYPRRGWITFFELRDSSPPGNDPGERATRDLTRRELIVCRLVISSITI